MSGTPEDAKRLFLDAIEQYPQDQWSDYLDRVCGDEPGLRHRVEVLLAAHAADTSLLDHPVVADTATIDQQISEKPGTQIGVYRLLQQIGEGGMGVVYLAEQNEPVARRVALKIIKPGMDTQQVIARFEAEEQTLAMMDHPNIAKVYDAGATDSGRPYFVMELVHGLPITQYCDQQHLTPRQRLDLFIPVCHAVQHAHQKGIIHRDIKPSNVLVALYDDQPMPKVIDFGVAKATSRKLTEATMFTQSGQVVGTVDYMSPEQADPNQWDVDTRSDIYSLGVLLYELLIGATPFDRQRLRSAAYDEMLRIIREEEPPKPSTRLSTSDRLPAVAANRQMEPRRLRTLVHGELDWIVMKAIDKDRKRRYETANSFAEDIHRFLNNEAVTACPPSTAYRFGKFARRNMFVLTTAVVVAAALFLGTVGTTWQAVRASRAERDAIAGRDRALRAERTAREEAARADWEAANANTKAAIAHAVNTFINDDLLGSADPDNEPNRDLTVREVVDQASQKIAERFTDQPLVKAEILVTIGNAYQGLGEYERAEQHFELARGLYQQKLGLHNRLTLRAMSGLAVALQRQNRYPKADELHRAVLDGYCALLGPDHEATLAARMNVANMSVFFGRYAEAEKLYRELLDVHRRLAPEEIGPTGLWHNLANAIGSQGRHPEAAELYREVLVRQRRTLPPENPLVLGTLNNLANELQAGGDAGQLAEAEELHRQVLDTRRRVLGPSHRDTIDSVYNLAHTLNKRGAYEDAIAVYAEAIALAPEKCELYTWRAEDYLAVDRFDDAAADCARYLAVKPDDLFVALMRAQALLLADRKDEYRRACVDMLDRIRQSENADAQCLAARICALLPAAVPDPTVPVQLAERSVARNGTPWSLYTLAMTHLRAGQLDAAAQRFKQSLDTPPVWDSQFLDWFGLALVSDARGEPEASREQLEGAMRLLAQHRDSIQQDRLEALLLLRELRQSRQIVEENKANLQRASTK